MKYVVMVLLLCLGTCPAFANTGQVLDRPDAYAVPVFTEAIATQTLGVGAVHTRTNGDPITIDSVTADYGSAAIDTERIVARYLWGCYPYCEQKATSEVGLPIPDT